MTKVGISTPQIAKTERKIKASERNYHYVPSSVMNSESEKNLFTNEELLKMNSRLVKKN